MTFELGVGRSSNNQRVVHRSPGEGGPSESRSVSRAKLASASQFSQSDPTNASTAKADAASDMNILGQGSPSSPPCSRS